MKKSSVLDWVPDLIPPPPNFDDGAQHWVDLGKYRQELMRNRDTQVEYTKQIEGLHGKIREACKELVQKDNQVKENIEDLSVEKNRLGFLRAELSRRAAHLARWEAEILSKSDQITKKGSGIVQPSCRELDRLNALLVEADMKKRQLEVRESEIENSLCHLADEAPFVEGVPPQAEEGEWVDGDAGDGDSEVIQLGEEDGWASSESCRRSVAASLTPPPQIVSRPESSRRSGRVRPPPLKDSLSTRFDPPFIPYIPAESPVPSNPPRLSEAPNRTMVDRSAGPTPRRPPAQTRTINSLDSDEYYERMRVVLGWVWGEYSTVVGDGDKFLIFANLIKLIELMKIKIKLNELISIYFNFVDSNKLIPSQNFLPLLVAVLNHVSPGIGDDIQIIETLFSQYLFPLYYSN
jgi:hypothetical protein